jgi:hypothetical protein
MNHCIIEKRVISNLSMLYLFMAQFLNILRHKVLQLFVEQPYVIRKVANKEFKSIT